jgi:PTS system mannose-specific IIA component
MSIDDGGQMIGIMVVAHFNLAHEMVAAVELIVGKQQQFESVGILPDEDIEKIRSKIIQALILTDMFGGTPANISLSFLEDGKIELVSGVNLPMLIKLTTQREGKTLDELARFITEYGQKNIYLATDVLSARKKE